MLKNIAAFSHEVEGKIGHFLLDHDCPVQYAKEMCFAFLKFLGKIEDDAKAKAEAEKASEPSSEKVEELVHSQEPKVE